MARDPASTDDSGRPAHEGYLMHARRRYLKLALILCVASIAAYIGSDPPGGRNGGTVVGYTLGTIGALLILWLTWLGVRKRRYRSNFGTVRGWTSAHVYLGLSLIVIATLHAAFQFGWNVHTVAYLLMCGVIGSGIYGISVYAWLPRQVTSNRTQGTREQWLAELEDLSEQSLKLADAIDPEVHRIMVRSVERIRIGGSLREQLFGFRKTDVSGNQFNQLQETLNQRLQTATGSFTAAELKPARKKKTDMMSTEIFMAGELAGGERAVEAAERVKKLLDLLARRRDLAARVNRDIRLQARLQIWLYVHVPLTFALLAALTAHIVSVFIYW
jgi:hypothetical protein